MIQKLILFILASVAICSRGTGASRCSSGEIECRNGEKCISTTYVCRSGRQCSDGSDEDPAICEFWQYDRSRCRYNDATMDCLGTCRYPHDFCSRRECASIMDSRFCKMVNARSLKKAADQEGLKLTPDLVSLVKRAVNSTFSVKYPECPMLYTRIGEQCISLFPAVVPWPEARQFCLSIFGDLFSFSDFDAYGDLLKHMRESHLTTDFWIGGRYDMDSHAWTWVSDDYPMPLGSPFWATKYSSSCVPRSPPHTDPFSDPASALPGAECYHYTQSPKQRTQGWCSALTYEHYYYISDEECKTTRSPICLLTHHPHQLPHQQPTVIPSQQQSSTDEPSQMSSQPPHQ